MRKLSVVAVFILLLSLAACGKSAQVITPQDGVANGSVGDTLRTHALDVVVESATVVKEYAGLAPLNKEKFIDIVVTLTNTTGAPLTLLDTDFQLRWGLEGFADTMVAYDDTMAPLEMTLAAGETRSCHYLYSVPASATDFSFSFIDEPDADAVGNANIFYVAFNI